MFQTFISRHNSNFFCDKLVLTSVTPASSAPVLQTPKARSGPLYWDRPRPHAGRVGGGRAILRGAGEGPGIDRGAPGSEAETCHRLRGVLARLYEIHMK